MGGLVELKAGESVSFTLPDSFGEDEVVELWAIMNFPQYDWSFWT